MTDLNEDLARAILQRAINDGRAAELLEALFDGGMVVLDPIDDRLTIIGGDTFRERFGTPDVDQLRQLVHALWAAWNDHTIRLHRALMEAKGGLPASEAPVLDLTPDQRRMLDETIRWAHGERP